jgi:hypothetical protein
MNVKRGTLIIEVIRPLKCIETFETYGDLGIPRFKNTP